MITKHIVALSQDPEAITVRYIGNGGMDVFLEDCRFSIAGEEEVVKGSLQLTLLGADVDALTTAIGRVIAEESAKREP